MPAFQSRLDGEDLTRNLWVSNWTRFSIVYWIDTEKRELIDNTLVDARPRYAVFSKDGSQLWVSAEIGGTVKVIDVASRQVKHTVNFAIRGIAKDKIQPVGITLTDNGRYAFVALGPANHVAVVNARTFEAEKYLLVGRRVWHLALTPDQKKLFSSNGVSNDVSVIDVDSLTLVKSIAVGRYPWGLAIKD